MKKVLVTILSIIYLSSSAGATVTLHYCMGKLYAADMDSKGTCAKCGMEKNKGCCSDEVKVIKGHDTHQATTQASLFQPYFTCLLPDYHISDFSFLAAVPAHTIYNNSPPGGALTSLCILHCVFRI